MRALVISDLHGNVDALLALERGLDASGARPDLVLVLGDLVDYGPAPEEVVAWVRAHADHVVRGNHDHAMVTREDCHSSPGYKRLSVATREYFRPRLSRDTLGYLAALPRTLGIECAGRRITLVHATPRDPLFEYLSGDAGESRWCAALGTLGEETDIVLVGHTHLPFMRQVGRVTVVNPGSLGQPKDGDPRGCYAVLDDGEIRLQRVAYDVDAAVARLMRLGLGPDEKADLARILRSGGRPGSASPDRGTT
jgi:predicted phosphodiesterase